MYEDIFEEIVWNHFETPTHSFYGLALSNMTGEDERPASASNYVYLWVHGTQPGGAASIIRSRMVQRSHSDEDTGFLPWGFYALAAWDVSRT